MEEWRGSQNDTRRMRLKPWNTEASRSWSSPRNRYSLKIYVREQSRWYRFRSDPRQNSNAQNNEVICVD